MIGDFIKIRKWLLPASWIYRLIVNFRNQMFELGFLKSRSFDTPVISVGNITVGGAGKTPHVEFLIRMLQDKVKVAVLSRGYKRKSKGYVLANDDTTMDEIGDEPYQMKQKFPGIYVAVDKDRCEGIDRLINDQETKDTDVILLDDAFQHRYVKPGINILLVDYHRLIIYDEMLPAGRLREPKEGKSRADIVIITKCPENLKAIDYRVLKKAMNLFPYQKLFYTRIEYMPLRQMIGSSTMSPEQLKDMNVLLLTGIASPQQIIVDMEPRCKSITTLSFADHHRFTRKDEKKINRVFESMPSPKVIITTEKDATRLDGLSRLSNEVSSNIYVLPIEIRFMLDEEEKFKHKIISYIRKNSKNSILVKRKDDHKAANNDKSTKSPRTISFKSY